MSTLDSDKNRPKIAHPSVRPLITPHPMANRSYLYSLSNRPAYADRPETIVGLSEWPYDVPFIYRLLMSGDPQPCASLVSDGMEDEEPGSKTRLYAISSVFEPGYARMRRFADIVRAAVAQAPAPAGIRSGRRRAPQPASFMDRVKQMFSRKRTPPRRRFRPRPPLPPDQLLLPRWTKRWPFSTPIATATCCWRPSSWTSCPTPAKPS